MIFVAALWGATNPLIKKYSAGVDNCQSVLEKLLFLIKAPLYLLSFLGNQLGSVLFYVLLGSNELAITVPVVNSLTLLSTAVTGSLLGESKLGKKGVLGILFIMVGTLMCTLNNAGSDELKS